MDVYDIAFVCTKLHFQIIQFLQYFTNMLIPPIHLGDFLINIMI